MSQAGSNPKNKPSVVQKRSGEDAATVFEVDAEAFEKLPSKYILQAMLDAGLMLNKEFGRHAYGSTACVTLVKRHGNFLKIYNMAAGDSFAVLLIYDKDGKPVGEPLILNRAIHSLDPKINPTESQRVCEHEEGRVVYFEFNTYIDNQLTTVRDYRLGSQYDKDYRSLNMSRSFGDFNDLRFGLLNTPETNFVLARIPPGGRGLILNLTDAFAPINYPKYLQWIANVVTPIFDKPCAEIAETLTARVKEMDPPKKRKPAKDASAAVIEAAEENKLADDASAAVIEVGGAGVFDGHGCPRCNDVSANLATNCPGSVADNLRKQYSLFKNASNREIEVLVEQLVLLYEELVQATREGTLAQVEPIVLSIKGMLTQEAKQGNSVAVTPTVSESMETPSESPVSAAGLFPIIFDVLNGKFSVSRINNPVEKLSKAPHHLAVELGKDDIFLFLFEQGADPLLPDEHGKSALQHFLEQGKFLMFQLMLQRLANRITVDDLFFLCNPNVVMTLNPNPVEALIPVVDPRLAGGVARLIAEYLNPFVDVLFELLKVFPNLLWQKSSVTGFYLLTLAIQNKARMQINFLLETMFKQRSLGQNSQELDAALTENFRFAAKAQDAETVGLFLQYGFVYKDFTFLKDHSSRDIFQMVWNSIFKPPAQPNRGVSIQLAEASEDVAVKLECKLGNLPAKYVLRGLLDAGKKMNGLYGRRKYSGSTACVTLVQQVEDILKIYCMSAGDSFGVLLVFDEKNQLILAPILLNRKIHSLNDRNWKSGLNMSHCFGDVSAVEMGELSNTPETNFTMVRIPRGCRALVLTLSDAFDSKELQWIADTVAPVLSKTDQEIAETLTTKVRELGATDDASVVIGSGAVFDGHGAHGWNSVSASLGAHCQEHVIESLQQQLALFNDSPLRDVEALEATLTDLYEELSHQVQFGTLVDIDQVVNLIKHTFQTAVQADKPQAFKLSDVFNGRFNATDINNPEEKCKPTLPLHHAARLGKVEVIKAILGSGVNAESKVLNARGNSNYTALSWAAQLGFVEIVDYLLSLKAEFVIDDFAVFNPFFYRQLEQADFQPQLRAVTLKLLEAKPGLLLEGSIENDPLLRAITINLFTQIEIFVDHLLSLAKNDAAKAEKVNEILKRNVNFAVALKKPALDIVKFFLKKGILPDIKTLVGCPSKEVIQTVGLELSTKELNECLIEAAKSGNSDCMAFLLDLGASVLYKDSSAKRAVDYAKKLKIKQPAVVLTDKEKALNLELKPIKEKEQKLATILKVRSGNQKSSSKNIIHSFFGSKKKADEAKEIVVQDHQNPLVIWFEHLILALRNNPGMNKLNVMIVLFVECMNLLAQEKWGDVNFILNRCHKKLPSFQPSEKIFATPKLLLAEQQKLFQQHFRTNPDIKLFEEVTGCKLLLGLEEKHIVAASSVVVPSKDPKTMLDPPKLVGS